jgi:catechol 2,3-dioxygenase-like lactoylglutathione lyase family enzyme
MLRGMANVSFWAEDVKAARSWYSELFGIEPYFQRPDPENPAYVEFRIGDYQSACISPYQQNIMCWKI